MFDCYGAKRSLAARYDPPSFPTIVEPFAGGAAFSVLHLRSVERVLLVEKDERVVGGFGETRRHDSWNKLASMVAHRGRTGGRGGKHA